VRGLALGAAIAFAVLATACGGGDDDAAENVGTTDSPTSAGVAACWKDSAERYKAAADEALPLLRDHPPDMVERYDKVLAEAGGPPGSEAFKKSFDRLVETLKLVVDGGSAFNTLYRAAEDAPACADDGGGAEDVDACWEDVARAYEEASERADVGVNGELGRMFDSIRTAIDAAERRESAAVRRGTRNLYAALDRLMPIAGRYARAQGAAERVYEECSAAA
jgi:hypothetical protein